mgnify:CR=1 FL=1
MATPTESRTTDLEQSFRNRILGAFVGQAIGDAIGFVLEKSFPERCQSYAEAWRSSGAPAQMTRQGFPFGQVSDDTQFSLHLARSLAECRRFDGADFAKRLTADFKADRLVGIGGNSRKAMSAFLSGIPWDQCGVDASSNGAIMRAWVPAAVFADPAELETVTRAHSNLTHRNEMAQGAAILAAHGMRHALEGGDPADLLSAIERRLTEAARSRRCLEALELTESILGLPLDEAAARAGAFAELHPDDWRHIPPDGMATFVWSFWSAINGAGDPLEAIRLGLSSGGDVDSTAAIAGAIIGASQGLDAFPSSYLAMVENNGESLIDEFGWLATTLADMAEHGQDGTSTGL